MADPDNWTVEGTVIDGLTDELRTWRMLELTFRTTLTHVENDFRPLDANSGSVDIEMMSDGGFSAVDRADGGNTFTIEAPTNRDSVRYPTTWHVREYTEDAIDQRGNRFEVYLSLVPSENKTPQASYSTPTRAADEWKLSCDAGDITTTRVEAGISQTVKDGTSAISLRLLLQPEAVQIIEESASRLDAVTTKEVPDGSNYTLDATSGGTNTLTLTPPDGHSDSISGGDYIVTDWETRWLNDSWYDVTLDLKRSE